MRRNKMKFKKNHSGTQMKKFDYILYLILVVKHKLNKPSQHSHSPPPPHPAFIIITDI